MNKFTKATVLLLLLTTLPLRHFAQQPRLIKVSEFSVSNIPTIEERVFMIHSINEKGYHCFKNPNMANTIDVYVASDASDELSDFDFFFDNELYERLNEFSNFDKEERGDLFVEWRQDIDNEVFKTLYEDFTRGLRSDNATCETAQPFCTDNGLYMFPAGVNSGSPCGDTYNAPCSEPYKCSGTPGQSSNCLSTAPNPAFYYMRIDEPGDLNIYMYSTPLVDIDFDCWGPFDDINTACDLLACSNIVDCSYSTAPTEHCHINNALHGQYYILLITNYSNDPCNISFENVGTGTTDCGILPPLVDNDGPYCEGETIHLVANGQPGSTYSWSGPNGFTSTLQNPTIPNCTLEMAGSYVCTITVGNQHSDATTFVEIYQQATPSFTATTMCQGQSTDFTGMATGANVAIFEWDFGDGETGSGQNTSHTYTEAGTYQVTLTVSAEDGSCPGEITQTVTVNAQPVAYAGEDQNLPYPGTTAYLSGSGGSDAFNYHWEPANMVVNPNNRNTQTVTLYEDQTYTLTVTNPQGQCTSTDEVTIYIGASPLTASAEASPNSLCEGSSTQLQVEAHGGSGDFSYSWSPSTGLSASNIPNPVATPSQTTTYTCMVSDNIALYTQSIDVTVTVYHHHTDGPPIVIDENHPDYRCDSIPFNWFGNTIYFKENGTYHFPNETYPDGQTTHGCDTARVVTVSNMKYSPEPSKMICTTEGAIVFGAPYADADTVAVITNTEFFSFQYDFMVEETGHNECIWNTCKWDISKPSWTIGDTIIEQQSNGFYYSKCTVYVAEHDDDYVILTATMSNGCDSKQSKFYLKSSFLSIDENSITAAKVSIVPNPNNGQMRINFEDMEGLTSIKVFDMTGNQIDAFETHVSTNLYSYDYTMKQHAEGIYLFAFTNSNRVFTKKVVIIQ